MSVLLLLVQDMIYHDARFSQGPFSAVVDKAVTSPWLRSFLDLECFVLSGMTAAHTL